MNITFTDILFGIIIFVVVGYGVIYYLRTQRTKDIQDLEDRKEKMKGTAIADQLFLLKNMTLSGQTKRKYESIVATWQTINNFQFTEIEAALVGAWQYSEQFFSVMKTKRAIAHASELVEEAEVQVEELEVALTELVEVETANQTQYNEVLERYNNARKSVMNHSFDYGPAIETLEKSLQYIELNFTKYTELMTNGDFLEAQEMLKVIEGDMVSLEDILEKIPVMYEQIKEEYEDSLDDLREGYHRMLDSRFNFDGVDIPEKIDEIQEKLDEAKSAIKNADLSNARTLMDKADRDIRSLYDLMETELKAKEYVNKHIQQLNTRMEELSESSRYAGIEVDRIAQSYILHENEVEQVAELTEQLRQEYQRLKELASKLDRESVVFTTLETTIKKIRKRVDELDEKLKTLVDNIGTLAVKERDAKSNLDTYELEMRNLKRRIEKSHLPGLNEEYYSLFYQVTDQIEYLAKQLNRVRIDIIEIEELQQRLESDLEQLEVITEEMVDSANLTEYMIQQSNRFRYDYAEIEHAIDEAQYLFHREYAYADALAVIEKALRRVDQEAPTQVRRMYHQEKQRRDY
ncbi:MAG: septation ring formation regulator EzrA [Aerococcaceae bacterium]|nr:septation ring formation regulator EzrA [Aerococcaceae bacterium]